MQYIPKSGVRFECQPECSSCCRISGGYVYLTEEEARKIARFLQIGYEEFLNTFIREIDHKLALYDGEDEACVFLEDHQCLIYEVRPLQCRTFPFWPENLNNESSWAETKELCPGIGHSRWYSPEEIRKILDLQE